MDRIWPTCKLWVLCSSLIGTQKSQCQERRYGTTLIWGLEFRGSLFEASHNDGAYHNEATNNDRSVFAINKDTTSFLEIPHVTLRTFLNFTWPGSILHCAAQRITQ